MEPYNIEVRFSEAQLQDEPKQNALSKYTENNFRLGLIFSEGDLETNEQQEPDWGSDVPSIKSELEQIQTMERYFSEAKASLKSGQGEHAVKIAQKYNLVDLNSPGLLFKGKNAPKWVEEVLQGQNVLPWTSADSITIFPLK